MIVTSKQLLNFLPFDDSLRQKILSQMDSYNPDQKLALEKILWDTYYEYLKASIDYEFQHALTEVEQGRRKLESANYRRIEKQVHMRFMRDLREQQNSEQINLVREQIKQELAKKLDTV